MPILKTSSDQKKSTKNLNTFELNQITAPSTSISFSSGSLNQANYTANFSSIIPVINVSSVSDTSHLTKPLTKNNLQQSKYYDKNHLLSLGIKNEAILRFLTYSDSAQIEKLISIIGLNNFIKVSTLSPLRYEGRLIRCERDESECRAKLERLLEITSDNKLLQKFNYAIQLLGLSDLHSRESLIDIFIYNPKLEVLDIMIYLNNLLGRAETSSLLTHQSRLLDLNLEQIKEFFSFFNGILNSNSNNDAIKLLVHSCKDGILADMLKDKTPDELRYLIASQERIPRDRGSYEIKYINMFGDRVKNLIENYKYNQVENFFSQNNLNQESKSKYNRVDIKLLERLKSVLGDNLSKGIDSNIGFTILKNIARDYHKNISSVNIAISLFNTDQLTDDRYTDFMTNIIELDAENLSKIKNTFTKSEMMKIFSNGKVLSKIIEFIQNDKLDTKIEELGSCTNLLNSIENAFKLLA